MPILRPKGSETYVFPEFLPNGRFVYTVTGEQGGILAGSLEGAAPVSIVPDSSSTAYVPSSAPGGAGHLLFRRAGTLMALPFDADKLRATGDVFPVADRVGFARNSLLGAFSASQNGILIYGSGLSGTAGRPLV